MNSEARLLFEETLEMRRKVLGPRHVDTAATMQSLAMLLDQIGETEKAKPLYSMIVEAAESLLVSKAACPIHSEWVTLPCCWKKLAKQNRRTCFIRRS